MRQDKKAQAGRLTFILARSIGRAFIAKDVEEKAVMNFLEQELSSP
jgi:3-dehydroquinate synthetase